MPSGFDVPFDARSAFVGGIAGVGTFSAIGVWASIGKLTVLLTSAGVSVGSASAVTAAIAAIGGPITLAVGLGLLAALATAAMFGRSWEHRLAKRIVDYLKKADIVDKLVKATNDTGPHIQAIDQVRRVEKEIWKSSAATASLLMQAEDKSKRDTGTHRCTGGADAILRRPSVEYRVARAKAIAARRSWR